MTCVQNPQQLESFCVRHTTCSHLLPVCPTCAVGQFCATDCTCMNHTAALLDMTLESAHDYYVVDHVNFTASSCAVNHGCALGGTNRRLLRFSTIGLNIGRQPYKPPVPAWHYPWIYQFNECHGHFHTQNVMQFELLDAVTERSTCHEKAILGVMNRDCKLAGKIPMDPTWTVSSLTSRT